MRTGHVEASLVRLNEESHIPHVSDLIALKLAGPEESTLDNADVEFHRREYNRLRGELEASYRASTLPEVAKAKKGLDNLLVRLRMRTVDEL